MAVQHLLNVYSGLDAKEHSIDSFNGIGVKVDLILDKLELFL